MPGALHDRAAGGAFAAHEHGDANQPFIAHHRDFRRGAVLHHVQQRDDRIGGEVHMPQGVAGLVERLAKWQADPFQVRFQPGERVRGQRGQQVILPGVGGGLHGRDRRE